MTQLRDQSQGAGQYVDRATQQVRRLSDYLQNTDVDQIVGRAADAARRQPAVFLGGAFALGLIGARFLRSSRRREGQQATGAGDYGSAAYARPARGGYGTSAGQAGATPGPPPPG